MATIQRPVKEGSVRTYQEKVGLGFVDILASEMDADLDTIYAAWNGGVDSVTLNDLAVTTPKLADGAVTTPKLGDAAVTTAKLGTKVVTGGNVADQTLNVNQMVLRSIPFAAYPAVNSTPPALDGTTRMMVELNVVPVFSHWALVSGLLVVRARRLAAGLINGNIFGALARGGTAGTGDGTQFLAYPILVSTTQINEVDTVVWTGLMLENPGAGNFRYSIVAAQDQPAHYEVLGTYARLDVWLFP
jgi:hypothetical protein